MASMALAGAGLSLAMFLGMAELRAMGAQALPGETASMDTPSPILEDDGGSSAAPEETDRIVAAFAERKPQILYLVFGTMVGVLFVSSAAAAASLVEVAYASVLLLGGVAWVALLLGAQVIDWAMRPLYWAAVIAQAVADLILDVAQLLASPFAAAASPKWVSNPQPPNAEEGETDPNGQPDAPRGDAVEGQESDQAPGEVAPSRNWRPLG